MNILGISGLENAMGFKRSQWPGLEEREYRISQGHDSAAALVVDGVPIAAGEEERFNRQKHSARFPLEAIRYCLSDAGLSVGDIDAIAHGFDYAPFHRVYAIDPITARLYKEVFSRDALLALVERDIPGFPAGRVRHVNHHDAHAASAYFTSGWDECLVAVVDAMGETAAVSVFRGRGGKLEKLHELSARDSIGILYSLVTLHLGFEFNSDEYKIMGLAPYGDPERFRGFFETQVQLCPDGSLRIPALRLNRTRDEREHYYATRRFLEENLIPRRRPGDEVTDAHRDVAAALQECLDRAMLHICGRFAHATGLRRAALAGGVALNCTANGRLLRSGLFDEIYIQPASGDDGTALGAALYCAAEAGEAKNMRSPTPFYGPAPCAAQIETALREFGDRIEIRRLDSTAAACELAARLIADGRVIAWRRGRLEFGPRALGHSSILADPGRPDMRDRINAMVKKREAFRPFAPAVTVEQAHAWFDVPPMTELPYMTVIVDVRKEFQAQLPAVTHVNGSARIQTVSARDNQDFHALLEAVGRTTGREMALNTSFNIKEQPIVNTPYEAVSTFLGTGIDHLFIENVFISRRAS